MNPSTICRHVANCEWPDVQEQKKITDGVFWFSSAGHGGCVALLDRFDEAGQTALRNAGKTEFVMISPGKATRCWYGGRFQIDRERYEPQGYTFVEVAVGEEDCDWACIFLANTDLIPAANEKFGGGATLKNVTECCYRWNPAFAAELGYVEDPD